MDNTESKKKSNKLSIIKKRRNRKGMNQNSKTQGGVCLQIQWHVILKTSIKKISVQDNERKHKTMSKKIKQGKSMGTVLGTASQT
jgi:hypothetical protein